MNRAELQRMAEERIKDASALLDAGRWEFAYYSAGYAIECALKSCLLARMVITAWVFAEKWDAKQCLTHDFRELIRLADLQGELNAKQAESGVSGGLFARHWGTVSEWKVLSRYESKTEPEASALYEAITHNPDGVLPWIQNYW